MRILYLSHCFPFPPDKGDRIRAHHQVRHLAERHSVHVLALTREPTPERLVEALEEVCASVEVFQIRRWPARLRSAIGYFGSQPLTLSYFRSGALMRAIEALRARHRIDLVIAYTSAMVPYLEALGDIPRALDMVDVDSAKWQQYAELANSRSKRRIYRIEAQRLRAYERSICGWLDQLFLTTSVERDQLLELAPGARCQVVTNGVDADHFAREGSARRSEQPSLVFTGQMDYFANVEAVCWFVAEVLPRVRRQVPDVLFRIVGRQPTTEVRDLAQVNGVEVTGEVEDIRPALWTGWVFVAPLRIARGVQNKVLEAMAAGLPVVATPGVADGLGPDFRAGEHLQVEASAAGMAEVISHLLVNAAERRRLSGAARTRIVERACWSAQLSEFEATLEGLVEAATQHIPAGLAGA